jgi:uncharacterized protein YgiM (DUF1202 family)
MAAVQSRGPISSNAAVTGSAVVAEAERFLGYPYAYTGDSPATGFSCIGFVWYVYHELGMNIPGTNPAAVGAYPQVAESNLQPGDLIFFQGTFAGLYPSHVAIYIGGGKIIGADNPSTGVEITSIVNDSRYGNYWQEHYLSAERPWSGPASPGTGPILPHRHHILVVVVPSLNLRSGPSLAYTVLTVLPRATELRVEGWAPGWVRVSTPAGTVGWVMREGVAHQLGGGTVARVHHGSLSHTAVHSIWASAKTIYVSSLRVHISPSLGAPVVLTLVRGNRVGVIEKYAGWAKIVTARGVMGWSIAQYLGPRGLATHQAGGVVRQVRTGRTNLRSGVNIHTLPSLNAAVLTVSNGLHVSVLHWTSGWAKVRLSSGVVGWVMRAFLGRGATRVTRFHRVASQARTFHGTGRAVLAGVRIHSGPSIYDAVISGTTAGMRVRVLGYSSGFAHIRTSSGVVGWIEAQFLQGAVAARVTGNRGHRSVHGAHATATIRLHSAAGLSGPVIGVVYAGERVRILGSSAGWDYVRLPSGQTGYVYAAYVAG